MASEKETLVLGGQARLPKELSTGEVFQIVVEMNPETKEIFEVSCGPCVPIIEKFVREVLIGVNLEVDLNDILEVVDRRLHHRSKKAVSTAIKDLVREIREYNYRDSKQKRQASGRVPVVMDGSSRQVFYFVIPAPG